MPYGGVRRRPGPLLGGSAILAKRNNQQRLQYLQQLQTIVHQRVHPQKIEKADNIALPNTLANTTHDLNGVDVQIPESKKNYTTSAPLVSNPFPDLLSHEVPQTSQFNSANQQSLGPNSSLRTNFSSDGQIYSKPGNIL